MSVIETVPSNDILELAKRRIIASRQVSTAPVRLQSGAGLPSRIAVVGNYLPRQCGIATFTTDLCDAISTECGAARLFAVPVNDTESGYEYPARVRLALAQDDLSSYEQAADFLNFTNFDLVCLQHEYGIFGGPAGSHILALLRRLKMPVITTLHTVLREPSPDQRRVMEEIAALSDRLIVMSELSSQFLQEIFKVPGSKIDMVPHGVPDLPFLDPNFYKDRFGVEGKGGARSPSACSRRIRESKTSFKRCRTFCRSTRMSSISSQVRPILTFCGVKAITIASTCRPWRRKSAWSRM